MDQLVRYYEVLNERKREDLYNNSLAMVMAFGRVYGTVKRKQWTDFMESLKKSVPQDVHKEFKKMQQQGLPVEDK